MNGKKVRIIKGKHCGQTGEVVGSENITGVAEPIYCVWLGCTDSALCCADEMEVVPCWPDACPL